MDPLQRLMETVRGTSRSGSNQSPFPEIRKINQSLYEFYKPIHGSPPTVEVIFFHGLQPDGDSSLAYVDSWISASIDEAGVKTTFNWPQEFLVKEFPGARILSVSYDSCAKSGRTQGQIDRYCTSENLIQDLVGTSGHTAGCPVVLVGQDIGGLIMKATCLQAYHDMIDHPKYHTFLEDIKGILYYATPHLGFLQLPRNANGALAKDWGLLDTGTSRLSEEFRKVRQKKYKNWKTKGIGYSGFGEDFQTSEATLRHDVDEYYTAPGASLRSVCRPNSREDIAFSYLCDLIRDSIPEPLNSSSTSFEVKYSLGFVEDDKYVSLESTMDKISEAFKKVDVVVLHGDSGTGKSSLARHFARIEESAHHDRDPAEEPSSSASSSSSCSRPVVVFLTCGREENIIPMLQKLLSIFGADLDKDGLQVQEVLRRTLVKYLKQRHALIILDDVWESKVLDNVVVDGANLKYLITSRNKNLWRDGNNSESIPIETLDYPKSRRLLASYANFDKGILPPEFEDRADELIKAVEFHPLALATLGPILETGIKSDDHEWRKLKLNLSYHLEKDENKPICFNQRYPLSVCAAMMLMVNLLDSHTDNHGARKLLHTICLFEGPSIPESVVHLFITATQPAADWEGFLANMKMLEGQSLLTRTRQKRVSYEIGEADQTRYSREGEDEEIQYQWVLHVHELRRRFIRRLNKPMASRYGSTPRQFRENGNHSSQDLAAVLQAIYGVKSVQAKAIKEMGDFYAWPRPGFLARPKEATKDVCDFYLWLHPDVRVSDDQCYFQDPSRELSETIAAYMLKGVLERLIPLMILEWQSAEEIHSSPSSMAATEVFWAYFLHRKFDGTSISILLKRPNCTGWILGFLEHCLVAPLALFGVLNRKFVDSRRLTDNHYWSVARLSIDVYLGTLVGLLDQTSNTSQSVQVQLSVIRQIRYLTKLGDEQVLEHVVECPHLLERLVMFVSQIADQDADDVEENYFGEASLDLCQGSLQILCELAWSRHAALIIANIPDCLEKLVGLLDEEYRETDLPCCALLVLWILSGTPYDDRRSTNDRGQESESLQQVQKIHVRMLETNLLGTLSTILAKDSGEIFYHGVDIVVFLTRTSEIAHTIRSRFPQMIETIFWLLKSSTSIYLRNQFRVMRASANLFGPDELEGQIRGRGLDVDPRVLAVLRSYWCYRSAMREDYATALNDINTAVELAAESVPEKGYWLLERGVLHRLMNNLPRALEDLNKAVEMYYYDYPDLYDCLKHRGLVKFLMGDNMGATADAQRAIGERYRETYGEWFRRSGFESLGMLSVEFLGYKLH